MQTFDKIVLHIPHSSNYMAGAAGWKKNPQFVEDTKQWTDWYTDLIFDRPSYLSEEQVVPVIFPYSRFYVDAERLPDDPLEREGQGIVYTRFNDNVRTVGERERARLMTLYHNHIDRLRSVLTPASILVDCHSFPSHLSDVAVCIGFNDDWSRPDDEVIAAIAHCFENLGLRVGINTPYSNSVSPRCAFDYKSVMIEVNKRCYMDERRLSLNPNFYHIANAISAVYGKLLGC